MSTRPTELGEFGLIDRLVRLDGLPERVVLGPGDDCAAIDDGSDELLLMTTDLMAEEVHFLRTANPEAVGDKLLSASLSDVAAMGGTPSEAMVSIAIPADLDVTWLDGLYRGLYQRAGRHGVALVGGDTTGSRSGVVLSLALTGRVARHRMLTRSGARAGDRIFVSGTLGDSAAGLLLLTDEDDTLDRDDVRQLVTRHLWPEPRVDLGRALGGVATAAIDLSDGLASDLAHVCIRSGIGALLELDRIPLSAPLRRFSADPVALAVGGGEDYELCFTAPAAALEAVRSVANSHGVVVTEIGEMVAEPGVHARTASGEVIELRTGGWDHFRTPPI